MCRVGQSHFGREITKYAVICGVYIYSSGQPYDVRCRKHKCNEDVRRMIAC